MPQLQRGMAAEVRQTLTFLLVHVLAVGFVGCGDRLAPWRAPDPMASDGGDGVADLVVILDGVFGFSFGGGLAAGAFAEAQQRRVEMLLFGFRVNLEEGREPPPERRKNLGLLVPNLVEQ